MRCSYTTSTQLPGALVAIIYGVTMLQHVVRSIEPVVLILDQSHV